MKFEIGKSYSVNAYWKKSLEETELWTNEETNQAITITTLWRNGTFIVTPQNEEEVEELQRHLDNAGNTEFNEGLEVYYFEDVEFDSTFDGVSTDLDFVGSYEWTEEEKETIEEGYNEDWTTYLETDLGMDTQGCEYYIYGGIEAEELADQNVN